MMTIMIVDDSLFIRNRLSKLLQRHGYQTIMAEDGVQAVNMYCSKRPDAVLMDITMPNKDGLTALSEICQYDRRARVIVLTAIDQKQVVARAIHMGAKDFLVKPVPPDQLLESLRKALRQTSL